MKDVLTLLKTPEFVREFSRLEKIEETKENPLIPFYAFVCDFWESEDHGFHFYTPCSNCEPDLNAFGIFKDVNNERFVLEIRKESATDLVH